MRGALAELPARIDGDDEDVAAVARRARLGAPIAACLEPLALVFGESLFELRSCLDASGSSGSDWPAALERLARSLSERASLCRSAEVAGAGATLSARIIAGLPLLMLPLATRQIGDRLVAGSVFFGLCLGIAGYRWLVRVVPAPPRDDPNAMVADEVAASLDAGISLDAALVAALSGRPALRSARRRARLGVSWRRALSADLPLLAATLRDAEETGVPLADTLRRAAASIRRDARLRFDREVQRAPVKMVLPLVSCCLPSFVLITIVPLLRGLTQPP